MSDDLISSWEEARANGVTRSEFADHLGISKSTLNNRLYRANRKSRQADRKDYLNISSEWDNYLEIDSKTKRITTLDDLIEACEIDLEEWIIERHIINKWEVAAKDAGATLRTSPLIQVKAWLVKRVPDQIQVIIKPVIFETPILLVSRVKKCGHKKALLIPDVHAGFFRVFDTGEMMPFHDRAALDIILQVATNNEFDEIGYLGDLLDLPDWSDKFLRSPEFYWCTQPAINELSWWMAQIRQASPGSAQWALEGNHDKRMLTAVMAHLLAAYRLKPATELNLEPALSVPRLLGLLDLGIEWIGDYPNGTVWLNDNLQCKHGDIARAAPGDTAKAVIQSVNNSVLFAHIHRDEKASRTLYDRNKGRAIRALSPGCVCRIDGIVPGKKRNQNWQQGFAVAYYDDDGYHSIISVSIENGRAIFEGHVYEARDRSDSIPAVT